MIQRRVLVVEDDPFVAGLLRDSLVQHGFVASCAGSTVEAKRLLRSFDPDVALVDVNLGSGPSGVDFVAMLHRSYPAVAPILLSQQASLSDISGVPANVAFLRKSMISDSDYLVQAIEEAARGHGAQIRHSADDELVARLTRTQLEVLRLIALGYTNTQIAAQRNVTTSGAEQAVSALFKTLGLSEASDVVPRVEAARLYIRAKGVPERSATP